MRRKKKGRVLGSILLASLLLGGCGSEELYEMQDNERAMIVNYAAHIVAKYNTQQPEGYQYVYVAEEEEAPTAQPEDAAQSTVDAQTPESTGNSATVQNGAQTSQITLTEALGVENIQAIYTGAELADSYGSVIPESGKQLLILHVTLQNRTDQKQPCDILSIFPTFRVKLNGSLTATAELSILPENLGTWEDALEAGALKDTIILFQIKKDGVTSVDKLELEVKTEKQTATIQFL